SMSGRIPLWNAIYRLTRDEPLGLGFAAAERLLTVELVDFSEVGWSATTAHSGYVSAWLAVGPGGLFIVLLAIAAAAIRCAIEAPLLRSFRVAAVLTIAVNNLTVV